MTLYAIHRASTASGALPQAVAERFSWFAALLPPVHALVHLLWGQLALSLAALAVVILGAPLIGTNTAFWLHVLFAVAFGLAAPGARRRKLERSGLVGAGYRIAPDADLARLASMEAGQ